MKNVLKIILICLLIHVQYLKVKPLLHDFSKLKQINFFKLLYANLSLSKLTKKKKKPNNSIGNTDPYICSGLQNYIENKI